MIDHTKRATLKSIALASGAGMTMALTGNLAAVTVETRDVGAEATQIQPMHSLASVDVTTRVNVVANDLEVVLTNTGTDAISITQITPNIAVVARGEFDFSALLADGPLHLAAAEQVSVPLQRRPPKHVESVAVARQALLDTLRKSLTIVTEGDAFASVSVRNLATFA